MIQQICLRNTRATEDITLQHIRNKTVYILVYLRKYDKLFNYRELHLKQIDIALL